MTRSTREASAQYLVQNDDQVIREALGILKRRLQRVGACERTALSSPEVVKDYLRLHYRDHQHETFSILHLDVKNRLVKFDEMFRGSITETAVYPREVVKAALQYNTSAVILTHNHPSGVADASQADKIMTGRLKQALELINVRTLDHIVVAGLDTYSFAENGQL